MLASHHFHKRKGESVTLLCTVCVKLMYCVCVCVCVSEVGGDEGVARPGMGEDEEMEVEECQVQEDGNSQQVHAPQQCMMKQGELRKKKEHGEKKLKSNF